MEAPGHVPSVPSPKSGTVGMYMSKACSFSMGYNSCHFLPLCINWTCKNQLIEWAYVNALVMRIA